MPKKANGKEHEKQDKDREQGKMMGLNCHDFSCSASTSSSSSS